MSEKTEPQPAPVWGWYVWPDGSRTPTTSDVIAKYVALYGQAPMTRFEPDPSAAPNDGAA